MSETRAMEAARLQRLTSFLERDPSNTTLLADAADAAFQAQQFDVAQALLDRHAAITVLPPSLINLRALIALAQERFDDAIEELAHLCRTGADTPQLRFNLAWALMMTGRFEEADGLLDAEAVAVSPRGPALKIQALHHLERYEDGLRIGAQLAAAHGDDVRLMGAMATLAMDADRIDLAQAYAERAGEDPDGLAARGLFALDGRETASALALFDRALVQQPVNPRAWVGKGLALLGAGKADEAAGAIERGAALFEDHLGSWVAAGWAYFLAGEADKARLAFDRVVAIDPTFAEGHGGIAVLDAVAGRSEEAGRNSQIALRLDRNSLGGALARSLLLEMAGETAVAEKIREAAMSAPIGPRGETLAQLLSAMGSGVLRS